MRPGTGWLAAGCLWAGLAVVLGAFAAHGLDGYLAEKYAGHESKSVAGEPLPAAVKYLNDFRTAAEYQMYHALGLITLGLAMRSGQRTALTLAGWSFVVGIVCFSGSLYVLVLTGQTWLGMVAPIGGTAFIVGWIAFAIGTRTGSVHAGETEAATAGK